MCDTIVASPEVTAGKGMLFGKNSDREPNEVQEIAFYPAKTYPPNSCVKCTYIEIPQVTKTKSILLSKPTWIWGAEIGVNDQSVAIGNEAIFSIISPQQDNGLIGMDLLRLALERSTCALEALHIIINLIEKYGQGGNCGESNQVSYHNSFIIADPREVWLLETVEKQWAALQIKGVYTISNCLTIGEKWDMCSKDLVLYAIDRGLCKNRESFHFADCFTDFQLTGQYDGRERQKRSMQLLKNKTNKITPQTISSILRDHHVRGSYRSPDKGDVGCSIYMHAGGGEYRGYQTTASMIGILDIENPTILYTGSSAPCTSIFKPAWLDTPLPNFTATEYTKRNKFSKQHPFWKHELLHRLTIRDYENRIMMYKKDRDQLENAFIQSALRNKTADSSNRTTLASDILQTANQAEHEWVDRLLKSEKLDQEQTLFDLAWKTYNDNINFPL